jgi:predicted transcriptional regulator
MNIQFEIRRKDISENKHGGNKESRNAYKRHESRLEVQRNEVLALISKHGGLSMKEVAALMDVPFNTVSGRGSELKQLGKVEKTGEVRDGSAVLRTVPVTVDELEAFLCGVGDE